MLKGNAVPICTVACPNCGYPVQSTLKREKPIDDPIKELVLNVYKYFVNESENLQNNSNYKSIIEKIVQATRISKETLYKILYEDQSEPKTKRQKKDQLLGKGKNRKEQVMETKKTNYHVFKYEVSVCGGNQINECGGDRVNECGGDKVSECRDYEDDVKPNDIFELDLIKKEIKLETEEDSLNDLCLKEIIAENISNIKQEKEELLVSYRLQNEHNYALIKIKLI